MTENRELIPPPEMVEQWECEYHHMTWGPDQSMFIAEKAARWGADQELEACCEWLDQNTGRWDLLAEIRAARRPKPLGLKEQALKALDQADKGLNESEWQQRSDIIRRALEQLDD